MAEKQCTLSTHVHFKITLLTSRWQIEKGGKGTLFCSWITVYDGKGWTVQWGFPWCRSDSSSLSSSLVPRPPPFEGWGSGHETNYWVDKPFKCSPAIATLGSTSNELTFTISTTSFCLPFLLFDSFSLQSPQVWGLKESNATSLHSFSHTHSS